MSSVPAKRILTSDPAPSDVELNLVLKVSLFCISSGDVCESIRETCVHMYSSVRRVRPRPTVLVSGFFYVTRTPTTKLKLDINDFRVVHGLLSLCFSTGLSLLPTGL